MPSSRGASQPRNEPVSLMPLALAVDFFTPSATWEVHRNQSPNSNLPAGIFFVLRL